VGGDADAVVPDGELDPLAQPPGGELHHRIAPPVAGGVLQKLSQEEDSPLGVGKDRLV